MVEWNIEDRLRIDRGEGASPDDVLFLLAKVDRLNRQLHRLQHGCGDSDDA